MTFGEFLKARMEANWVLYRRTKRIVLKYGEDVVCISQRRYAELEAEYQRQKDRGEHA